MSKSKYIGTILENRWEVVDSKRVCDTHRYSYVVRNIYNGEEMTISPSSFFNILNGTTSINSLRKHAFKQNNSYKKYYAKKHT